MRSDERHIRADSADVGNVVVDAFQFQTNGPQRAGTRRCFYSSDTLDGVAKRRGVREARIPGDALGESHAMGDGQVLEKFLGAFVHVEHPQLEIKDGFARHTEKKVPRLDDARVNRADRHLEHAFAFDLAELVPHASEWRELRAQVEVFAERIDFRPVVV